MKVFLQVALVAVLMFCSGCAASPALLETADASSRSDVFEKTTRGGSIPVGFAELRVTASLKTHKPGLFSAKDVHGTPEYQLLINIDGQAARLQGRLSQEKIHSRLLGAEAGDGIRYHFLEGFRLRSGVHTVVVASPADGIAVERQILLPEGIRKELVLKPVYGKLPGKQRPGFYGLTKFSEGLRGFKLFLDGEPLS